MFEGGQDWAQEDELDLGHEDGHGHARDHINGTSGPSSLKDATAHVEEGVPSPVVNGHHLQTSTAVGAVEDDDALPLYPPPSSLPPGQQHELSGIEERASTPDDTPSLQVGACFYFIFYSA